MRCARFFLLPSVASTGASLSVPLSYKGAGSTTTSCRHLHPNTLQEEGVPSEARTGTTGATLPSSASTSTTVLEDGTSDFIQSLLSRRRLLDRPIYEHFCSIFTSSSSSPLSSSSASSSPSFLAHPSVALAVTCIEELEKVETICSLHLSQQSQWDRLLVSNTAMQERLAQLSSWRCGLQSLFSYVSHHHAEQQPSASSRSSPEVAVLQIFAEMAMLESASLVREMVDASLWPTAVPHVSCPAPNENVMEENENPATPNETDSSSTSSSSTANASSSVSKGTPGKLIDYPYIEEFLEVRIPSLFLQPHTRSVPSMVEHVYAHILPLLSVSSPSGGKTSAGSIFFPFWRTTASNATPGTGTEKVHAAHPNGPPTPPTSSLWSFSSKKGSLLSRMMGMHSGGDGGFHLHAPHILLQHTAKAIEQQMLSFLQWIDLQNASKPFFSSSSSSMNATLQAQKERQKTSAPCGPRDVLWGSRVGMGLADIFASVSILHRGSAALLHLETQEATASTPGSPVPSSTSSKRIERGEEKGGAAASNHSLTASPLDALFAQSFPFFSNQRVSRYMHEVNLANAMMQPIQTTAKGKSTPPSSAKNQGSDKSPTSLSIDGSATHPIVLASFGKK